jgi:hypothetical protein
LQNRRNPLCINASSDFCAIPHNPLLADKGLASVWMRSRSAIFGAVTVRAVKGAIAPLRGFALDCTTFRLFDIISLAGLGFLVSPAATGIGQKSPASICGAFFCAYRLS